MNIKIKPIKCEKDYFETLNIIDSLFEAVKDQKKK